MVKQAVADAVGLEPIERLEEKITTLVALVARLRSEQARTADDNGRLMGEVETLRARLAEVDGKSDAELTELRQERDVIRTRVDEMLQQLEHLSM